MRPARSIDRCITTRCGRASSPSAASRSEEHTSELQSRLHLVCRLLLGKKTEPLLPPPSAAVAKPPPLRRQPPHTPGQSTWMALCPTSAVVLPHATPHHPPTCA